MVIKIKYIVIGIFLVVFVVFILFKLIYYKVINIKLLDGIIGCVCSLDMIIFGLEVLVFGLMVFLIIIFVLGFIVMIVFYCLVVWVIYK